MATNSVFPIATSLSITDARAIIAGALAEARDQQAMPLTVVVLDAGGHLVAMEREDGSGLLRFQVANGKAYGALGIGLASGVIGTRNQERAPFLTALAAASDGCAVPVAGGVLILNSQQQIIGAVGISGDTSDIDEHCALAGMKQAGLTAGIEPSRDLSAVSC